MTKQRDVRFAGDRPVCSPSAIQACLAALAAEALEGGHPRAAMALASVADLLGQPALWEGGDAALRGQGAGAD